MGIDLVGFSGCALGPTILLSSAISLLCIAVWLRVAPEVAAFRAQSRTRSGRRYAVVPAAPIAAPKPARLMIVKFYYLNLALDATEINLRTSYSARRIFKMLRPSSAYALPAVGANAAFKLFNCLFWERLGGLEITHLGL